jgi:tetratricopeptide (TPR) repeat protein
MKKKQLILSALLLLIVTFAALSPSLIASFSNWDDQIMITQNTKIMSMSWKSIKVWFTTFHERLYHPLVLMSYAVEYHFFKFDARVYHATNLVLHLLNTLFVFWFVYLISKKNLIALITALLFGIHPMHVESVIWLPERKDVLYSFFFLGSLISYLYFLKDKKRNFYYLCMFLFTLSFLSKSMAMTLPFILLLCDYLLKVKIDRKNLIDKVPFFALSFLFAFITVMGHYEPGVEGREFSFSLIGNIVSACQNIVFYLIKLVLPFKLSCIYPPPSQMQNIPQVIFFLAPVIVIALIALMFWSGKYSRIGIFGGLFFLVTVAPVSQILPVGLRIPADRYTYIPYIGFFYIFAECFALAYEKYDKKLLMGLLSALFLVLFILSFQRALVWRKSTVLWDDVIRNYKNIPIAYFNRADEYFLRTGYHDKALADNAIGEPDKAIAYYDQALKINPYYVKAWYNRGIIYLNRGEFDKAISDFSRTINLRPNYADALNRRGGTYFKMENFEKAYIDFSQAIRADPNYADAYYNRGLTCFKMGNFEKAYIDFSQAIQADPTNADAYYDRAAVSTWRGDAASALSDVLKAQSLGKKVDQQVIDKLRMEMKK